MDVVYGETFSMLGVFSSFTSFLGRPFLLWSPYFFALLGEMMLNAAKPEKDRMMETTYP
ncbi:hypothetical protein Hanom_Chr08g00754411 [Helianthus anomalus]